LSPYSATITSRISSFVRPSAIERAHELLLARGLRDSAMFSATLQETHMSSRSTSA
jgi:hypothetical protein